MRKTAALSVALFAMCFSAGTMLAQCMLDTRPDVELYFNHVPLNDPAVLNPCEPPCCVREFEAGVATRFPPECYGRSDRDE